jgi:hypothetical protein
VNSSVSLGSWLGMVEPVLKEVRCCLIVPWKVEMIKTELIGIECGWELGAGANCLKYHKS